jgi:hypothetical protein
VTREASSHEVISAGFWFGDASSPAPAFSSCTSPGPAGLVEEPLRPPPARWVPSRGAHLAVLPYDDVRAAPDPAAAVLESLGSACCARERRAGWDAQRLRSAYAAPLPTSG